MTLLREKQCAGIKAGTCLGVTLRLKKEYDVVQLLARGHGLARPYYLQKLTGFPVWRSSKKAGLGGGNTGRNTNCDPLRTILPRERGL